MPCGGCGGGPSACRWRPVKRPGVARPRSSMSERDRRHHHDDDQTDGGGGHGRRIAASGVIRPSRAPDAGFPPSVFPLNQPSASPSGICPGPRTVPAARPGPAVARAGRAPGDVAWSHHGRLQQPAPSSPSWTWADMRKVGSTDDGARSPVVRQADSAARRAPAHPRRDGVGEAPEELGLTSTPAIRRPCSTSSAGRQAGAGPALRVDRLEPRQRLAARTTWTRSTRRRPQGDAGVRRRARRALHPADRPHPVLAATQQVGAAARPPRPRAIAATTAPDTRSTLIELAKVLAKAPAELGGPLELLGMDACLMSNLEVAYQARERRARRSSCSEDLEPGDGWPVHQHPAPSGATSRRWTGPRWARVVVEEYLALVRRAATTRSLQCAVDVSRLAPLHRGVRGVHHQPAGPWSPTGPSAAEISDAHLSSVRFQGQLVDVRSLCRNLPAGRRRRRGEGGCSGPRRRVGAGRTTCSARWAHRAHRAGRRWDHRLLPQPLRPRLGLLQGPAVRRRDRLGRLPARVSRDRRAAGSDPGDRGRPRRSPGR